MCESGREGMADIAERRKSLVPESAPRLGLSGYLNVWRKSGPLKLRKKSREWFVLNSQNCELLFGRTPSDIPLQPNNDSCVNLIESTLSFGSETGHFIITCGGKDLHLGADDHAGMMRWVNTLQAVREQHREKLQQVEIDGDVFLASGYNSEEEADPTDSEVFLPEDVVQDIEPDHQDDEEIDDCLFGRITSITAPELLSSDGEDAEAEKKYSSLVLEPSALLDEFHDSADDKETTDTKEMASRGRRVKSQPSSAKGREKSSRHSTHLTFKQADRRTDSLSRQRAKTDSAQTSSVNRPSLVRDMLPAADRSRSSTAQRPSPQQQSNKHEVLDYFKELLRPEDSNSKSYKQKSAPSSPPRGEGTQKKSGTRRSAEGLPPLAERLTVQSADDESDNKEVLQSLGQGLLTADVGDLVVCEFKNSPAKPGYQNSLSKKSTTPVGISNVQAGQSPAAAPNATVEKSILQLEQDLKAALDLVARMERRESAYKELLSKQTTQLVTKEEERTVDNAQKRKSGSHAMLPTPSHTSQMQQEIEDLKTTADRYHEQNIIMTKELVQIIDMRKGDHHRLERQMRQCETMMLNMLHLRVSYLTVLQESLPVNVEVVVRDEEEEIEDPGEAMCQKRILAVLAEACREDENLPHFEEPVVGSHTDSFGFVHQWEDHKTEMQHYLVDMLKRHYRACLPDSAERQREASWSNVLAESLWGKQKIMSKSDGLKKLILRGIPDARRADIWKRLVSLRIGKLREEKGKGYYQQLEGEKSPHKRQIQVDLHRTLTSNEAFCKGSETLKQLCRVLLAYSVHNQQVGYCQGMNMLAGVGLLILKDEEEAFWLLAAIIEQYMPPHYFDESLIGAQADQLVMKELLQLHLPGLSRHFDFHGIDVGLVTFNWCLTIFVEIVPVQTLLRIWDCFLFEGSRVLFRFSLAILYTNAARLRRIHDPVTLFQCLKLMARLAFDENELTKIGYISFHPFASQQHIKSRRETHVAASKTAYKEDQARKEQRKRSQGSVRSRSTEAVRHRPIVPECATTVAEDMVWVCEGDQSSGFISLLRLSSGQTAVIDGNFQARIMCIAALPPKYMLIGTLSGKIMSFLTSTACELFTKQLKDSVLSLATLPSGRTFAGLADGTLVVFPTFSVNGQFQDVSLRSRMSVTSLLIVESTPHAGSQSTDGVSLLPGRQELKLIPEDEAVEEEEGKRNQIAAVSSEKVVSHLWCGCGNLLIVLDVDSLEEICSMQTSANRRNNICQLRRSQHGVWTTTHRTATVQLWNVDSFSCVMEINCGSLLLRGLSNEHDNSMTSPDSSRATGLCIAGDHLWLGTADGYLLVNQIVAVPEGDESIKVSGSSEAEKVMKADESSKGGEEESGVQERKIVAQADMSVMQSACGVDVKASPKMRLELVQLHRVSEDAVRCLTATKLHDEEVLLLCVQQKQPQLWSRSYEAGGGVHWKSREIISSPCSVEDLLDLVEGAATEQVLERCSEGLDGKESSKSESASAEPEVLLDKEEDKV